MNEETHSSNPDVESKQEKGIGPRVCAICGASEKDCEIYSIGSKQQLKGLCVPHWEVINEVVEEGLYTALFVNGLESWLESYKEGRE